MNALTDTEPQTAPTSDGAPISDGDTVTGRGRHRFGLKLAAALLILATGWLAGRWWLIEGRFVESTDNAYVQGDIATLSARIDGDVLALPAADNQAVRKGDPLVVLDPRDWQARLDQAEAAVGEARAALVTTQRQVGQARDGIDQAQAQVALAKAELARAGADAQRSTALVGAGWTSRQANDQAVATLRKAEANTAAALAQHSGAVQALAVAEAQQNVAAARLVSAEAQARLAANNRADTVLRAPFDGIVGNRAVQIGQHVQPGEQLLALAPMPRQLYVVANFKETQLRQVHSGDPVTLTADIAPDSPLTGHVDSLAPATGALFSLLPPENATGNFTKVVQRVPVRIALDFPDGPAPSWLRAGLSVVAEVDTRGPGAVHHGLLASLAFWR
jgi:membrane fusion protein (multidrug efflux system)